MFGNRSEKGISAVIVVLALSSLLVPIARADLGETIFEIVACRNGTCVGVASFPQSAGSWNGDTYTWTLAEDTPIYGDGGEYLATLTTEDTGVWYNNDPQVNLSFSVVAGPSETEFWIKSALLAFPTIAQPKGRASTAFTLTDAYEDGAYLSPVGGDGAYTAQYNGFVPNGTQFCQMITPMIAEPEGTANLAQDYPGGGAFNPIGTSAYDMSTQVRFTLSADDMASGTSNFEIQPIPEPSTLLLIAAAVAPFLRRR